MGEAADRAYEAAKREIARAKAERWEVLDLNDAAFHALDRIPSEITELRALRRLGLDKTQVSDVSPIAALSELRGLWLDRTQVADISPIASLSELKNLSLIRTKVSNLTPLISLLNLQGLHLDWTKIDSIEPLGELTAIRALFIRQTRVNDIAPVATNKALATMRLDHTPVIDLRPLRDLDELGSDRGHLHLGLSYSNTPSTQADGELARLSRIPSEVRRARETLAYLRSLPPWPEPYTPAARRDGKPPQPIGFPSIPAPSPAPLEVVERDGQLRQVPPSDGLAPAERDPAREGWEALLEALEDLSHLRPRLGNQMPGMARALIRFEAALGKAFEEVRPIKLGAAGNRVMALAETAEETLQPADAAELRELAAAIAVFMERFPDWVSYRDKARAAPLDQVKVAETTNLIEELAREVEGREGIHEEIPQSLDDQIAAVKDALRDPVAARGLQDSARNVLLGLARAGWWAVKQAGGAVWSFGTLSIQKTMDLAAKSVSVAALDIFANKAGLLHALAKTSPEAFGWLTSFLRALGL